MEIYNTVEEIEADAVDGILRINDDVTFNVSFDLPIDVDARDIKARDIKARNINARDIKAADLIARNIFARDINYWAVCSAEDTFVCRSIKGRRKNSRHFCLDSEIVITNAGNPQPETRQEKE